MHSATLISKDGSNKSYLHADLPHNKAGQLLCDSLCRPTSSDMLLVWSLNWGFWGWLAASASAHSEAMSFYPRSKPCLEVSSRSQQGGRKAQSSQIRSQTSRWHHPNCHLSPAARRPEGGVGRSTQLTSLDPHDWEKEWTCLSRKCWSDLLHGSRYKTCCKS